MAKYRVLIARLCVSGSHRAEVGNWLVEVATVCARNPDVDAVIDDVIHVPIQRVGTDVARNLVVATARKQRADVVFMCDDDMSPPEGFFRAALDFLAGHHGPAALGCPYVCAPPNEEVQVFQWAAAESGTKDHSWGVRHVIREDAIRRTGIERVDNLGTGLIAYRADCFARIESPYFAYTYNADHTAIAETEDTYCHRHLAIAGVPLYVSWDHWADHYKTKRCSKPVPIRQHEIDSAYLEAARYELHETGRPVGAAGCGASSTAAEKTGLAGPSARPVGAAGSEHPASEGPLPVARAAEWAASVPGWMSTEELAWLADQARRMRAGDAWVELGAWKGRSLSAVVLAAPAGCRVVAVDTWEGSPAERDGAHREATLDGDPVWVDFCRTADKLRRLRPAVKLDVKRTRTTTLGWPADIPLAVVFVDASHEYDDVREDIEAWWPLVRPGGMICGHDCNYPGVATALADLFDPVALQYRAPGSLWYVVKDHPDLSARFPACRARRRERGASEAIQEATADAR